MTTVEQKRWENLRRMGVTEDNFHMYTLDELNVLCWFGQIVNNIELLEEILEDED